MIKKRCEAVKKDVSIKLIRYFLHNLMSLSSMCKSLVIICFVYLYMPVIDFVEINVLLF